MFDDPIIDATDINPKEHSPEPLFESIEKSYHPEPAPVRTHVERSSIGKVLARLKNTDDTTELPNPSIISKRHPADIRKLFEDLYNT